MRQTPCAHCTLNSAVGDRTEISVNTGTGDSLTNGSGSVIKLTQVHQTDRPSGII